MNLTRRSFLAGSAAAGLGAGLGWCAGARAAEAGDAGVILRQWYRLVLRLVRHTPTYSPPVASRSFAYLGVAAYEAVASGSSALVSLAGQLNGLNATPRRQQRSAAAAAAAPTPP